MRAAKTNGGGSRLQIYVGAAAVLATVLGGGWKYVSDYAVLQQQAVSNNTRIESLQKQIGAAEGKVSVLEKDAAANLQKLIEIETQFCAEDHVRNLMHGSEQRQLSLVWQKTFGQPYPTDNAYYPIIGKCGGDAR